MANIFTNQQYLLNDQYKNASNLNARIQLHERFSTSKEDWHRWVFEHIKVQPDSHILELGSGPAHLWKKNLDRLPQDWDVTLSDFSAGMVEEAKQSLQGSNHPFYFQTIDAQSIPFADASFDIVIANHMLYHVPDKARALAEIRRVLKPEGIFYATTVGEAHLREIDLLAWKIVPDFIFGKEASRNFTLENGAAQLEGTFTHVSLDPFEDGLVVTEVEPLMTYILSGTLAQTTTGEQIQALRKLIEDEIAQRGAFHITKASGLFEAYGQK